MRDQVDNPDMYDVSLKSFLFVRHDDNSLFSRCSEKRTLPFGTFLIQRGI